MSITNEILNIEYDDFERRVKNVFKHCPEWKENYKKDSSRLEFLKMVLDGHLPNCDNASLNSLVKEAQLIAYKIVKNEEVLDEISRKNMVNGAVMEQRQEARRLGISEEDLAEREKGLDDHRDEDIFNREIKFK